MLFEQFFLFGRELGPLAPQLVAQFFRSPGKALLIGFRSLPLSFPGLAVAAHAFAFGFELSEFGAQPVQLGRLGPAGGGLRVGPGLLLGGEMGSGGIQFGLGLVQLRGPSGELGRFLGDRLGSSLGGGSAGGLAGRSGGNRLTLFVELLLHAVRAACAAAKSETFCSQAASTAACCTCQAARSTPACWACSSSRCAR